MRMRRWVVYGMAVAATLSLAGCGSSLSKDSSCKDFLNASATDQDAAVKSIASDMHAANAVTPLGRPNIDYLCAGSPDKTLGEAIQQTG